jgi:hypothetical protein
MDSKYEEEYARRNKEYNRLNRSMYHVYAASAHVIHDNNFLSYYCRPALRNLPESTAYQLETLKAQLRPPKAQLKPSKAQQSPSNNQLRPLDPAGPPYRTIQAPTHLQTQPVFNGSKPSYSDVVRPSLKPREPWMKEDPPL